MLKYIQVQKDNNISLFFEVFSYNSGLKLMFIIVLAGPSTKILHSFNEDRNGSITLSVKAEHAHSTSTKFSWHGI